MLRSDFKPILDSVLDEIDKLFTYKNKSYGTENDLFHNFRNTARRVVSGQYGNEYEDMFRVLACYVDKHWVALCNRGLGDAEFEERCKDIIIYMLLAIAMGRDWQGLTRLELATIRDEDRQDNCGELQGWIPINEQLPPKGECLVVCPDGTVHQAGVTFGEDFKDYLYWMPMPRPPKGGKGTGKSPEDM